MLRIRPAQTEDAFAIARVHVDTWRTTYVGIVPDEHLANLSYERCQAGWVRALSNHEGETHTFVAEVQPGQVVGFACGGPIQDMFAGVDGELYNVYVLKSFQGKRCGKRLVTRVARDLRIRGFHALVIWVLKENLACLFYERLGGQLAAEKVVEIGGKLLTDVAYVWPDLAAFEKDEPSSEWQAD